MRHIVLCIALSCFAVAAHADQLPFGPWIGRVNAIYSFHSNFTGNLGAAVEILTALTDDTRVTGSHVAFGPGAAVDTSLSLVVPSPGFPLPPFTQAKASCVGSNDSTCGGLQAINGCAFSALPAIAKTAINYTLGVCSKVCTTAINSVSSGEVFTTFTWQCGTVAQGNCLSLSGIINRIDVLDLAGGCQ